MFKSFFPQPAKFFLSAFIWGLLAVILWEAGGKRWIFHYYNISDKIPVGVNRFWSDSYLVFYAWFLIMFGSFALFWVKYQPHRWQYWSIHGSALIIFVTWFQVEIGVAINAWYQPFYDLVQKALTEPNSVKISELYYELSVFLLIALVAVAVGTLSNFFISHYVFRWRTAMNHYYMQHWQHLRKIEGASQRVQEDTMQFAKMLEDLGVRLLQAVMTLIAFLPVLVALSSHVKVLPLIGEIPYGLVIAAIIWSLFGTGLLMLVGIKLPGLQFNNQRVEAAYRKELVYGEDDAQRAEPVNIKKLFLSVQKNYFRLYFHYMYFNVTRIVYLQLDAVFNFFLLFPSIVGGTLTLGLMLQINNVFSQVRSAFQYLIRSWSSLVELMSVYKRLRSFEAQLDNIMNREA